MASLASPEARLPCCTRVVARMSCCATPAMHQLVKSCCRGPQCTPPSRGGPLCRLMYMLLFLQFSAISFYDPARRALEPQIVPKKVGNTYNSHVTHCLSCKNSLGLLYNGSQPHQPLGVLAWSAAPQQSCACTWLTYCPSSTGSLQVVLYR